MPMPRATMITAYQDINEILVALSKGLTDIFGDQLVAL